MSNTINVTISENAVLAHALYQVIDEHYNYHYLNDFVSHLPKSVSAISILLKYPSFYCNLHFIDGVDTEQLINQEWSRLFEHCDKPYTMFTYFFRDLLYCMGEYDSKNEYGDNREMFFTNAGKIVSIIQNYIDGETTSPVALLETLDETDFFSIGKSSTEEYMTGKVRTETRTDDFNDFFANLECFEKGTIETNSDFYNYETNFNHIAYDGVSILFYEMKKEDDCYNYSCNSRFALNADDIKTIKITDTQSTDDSVYHIYLITMSDGAEFMITTFYYK